MKKAFIKTLFFTFSILIISSICAKNVFADSPPFEEKRIFKEAKKHFKKECYNLALPYFSALQKLHPDNPNFNYYVGMCYYNTSSMYDSCIHYLTLSTKAVTLYYNNTFTAEKAPAKAYYYLGIAYLRNNMAETAIRHFKHYQRFLDPEVKSHQAIKRDIDLQIQVCEAENEYAKRQREIKASSRDSLSNEIAFYKTNYLGTAQLLEENNNEVNQLLEELQALSKSQSRPIGTSTDAPATNKALFIIQIMATEKDVPMSNFNKVQDVKKCRTADGLYYIIAGEFTTRAEADKKCREIRDLGYSEAWVRPVFSCK